MGRPLEFLIVFTVFIYKSHGQCFYTGMNIWKNTQRNFVSVFRVFDLGSLAPHRCEFECEEAI